MSPQRAYAAGLLLVALAFMPGVSSEPTTGPDPCDSVAIELSSEDCGDTTDDPVSCWAPAIWPPRSSTCQVGPAEVHCGYEWTFVEPFWVPTDVDCQVTDPPVGAPTPHCDPILDASETEVGVSCGIQNTSCTQAIWGIHEDWITLGGNNGCHVMVRFNGEAFQDHDPVHDGLLESCSAMVDVEFFNGAGACDLHWLACPTGSGGACPPPPQPLPVPECHQTLQYPPTSSECQVGGVSVDCTSQWTIVSGLFVPEHYECTASEEDTGAGLSCAAFTDDDGWRGYDCTVHGMMCHQALWGVHEDDLVVGGYNGCNVVVKTNIV